MGSSVAVRRLLRRLRTPHLLHDDPLARAIAAALDTRSPRDGVLALVERVLRGHDPRYRQLVELFDVHGEPGKVAADALCLSERTFYRMRAVVVDVLERAIDELLRDRPPRTHDFDAVAWYALGRRHASRRTKTSLDAALECFRNALACEPAFAAGFAAIAHVHLLAAEYAIVDERVAFAAARDALQRARELEPRLADVLTTSGDLALYGDRDRRRARAYFDAALAIDPAHAAAHQNVAWLALAEHRPDLAATTAANALVREPSSIALQTTLGLALFEMGLADRARDHLQAILDADPDFVPARFHLAAVLVGSGAFAEALTLLERLVAEEPMPTYFATAAHVRARLGDARGALADLARIEAAAPRDRSPHVYRAIVMSGLGRDAAALRALRAAVREGSTAVCNVCLDPFLRSLHGVGDYDALVASATA
ncbi:MAG TPA: tetratricopeptide repeat protein [Candidatus Elarobacter sp.]|nr:tetratricopeptide repeat protein [Candidatus Elarobacter sp.]